MNIDDDETTMRLVAEQQKQMTFLEAENRRILADIENTYKHIDKLKQIECTDVDYKAKYEASMDDNSTMLTKITELEAKLEDKEKIIAKWETTNALQAALECAKWVITNSTQAMTTLNTTLEEDRALKRARTE
jgi:cell fate (sporulation/competence/biofilm development) regulator YlbF (YheA/YmcA/DUF963 family)